MSLPEPLRTGISRDDEFNLEVYVRLRDGIRVDGSSVYTEAGSNAAVGLVNSTSASSADTDLLTVGTDNQVQYYTLSAGVGAYTYNIDLDTTDAYEGSVFYINIDKAASTNPTINVRNGSGGSNILSINNASAENYGTMFIFDGTNWLRFICNINDL